MYMTARRTYTALILSVIALFVSACDKTCPGGPDSNVVEKTYRFEIAVAADETLSWVETVNIMMPEVMPISGFMWSCVRELRIDYSDGVSVDGQSLPEERRTDMRAYAIIGTSRPQGGIDGTARYVFTNDDYRYAAEHSAGGIHN